MYLKAIKVVKNSPSVIQQLSDREKADALATNLKAAIRDSSLDGALQIVHVRITKIKTLSAA